jgi:hypothetical protein
MLIMKPQIQWSAIQCDRKYLSIEFYGSREGLAKQLEKILKQRKIPTSRVEVMTDQVDVFIGQRRVAVYVP